MNNEPLRYNPSTKKDIASVYRPWYVVVTLLSIIVGGALIAMAILIKVYDDDMDWLLCHIWTGIPLAVGGILAIIPCGTRSKVLAMWYGVFMFGVLVACATGAVMNGLEYWLQYWQQTRLAIDKEGACNVSNGLCVCSGVVSMPTKVDDCDSVKIIVYLMMGEIVADAAGFMISLGAVFLSFMSVCCGPWVHLESYKRDIDPDFAPAGVVTLTKK